MIAGINENKNRTNNKTSAKNKSMEGIGVTKNDSARDTSVYGDCYPRFTNSPTGFTVKVVLAMYLKDNDKKTYSTNAC